MRIQTLSQNNANNIPILPNSITSLPTSSVDVNESISNISNVIGKLSGGLNNNGHEFVSFQTGSKLS